jgi:hypothetical protein
MFLDKDFVGPMVAPVKQLSKDEYEEQKSIEFETLHIHSAEGTASTWRAEEKKKEARHVQFSSYSDFIFIFT